MPPALWPDNSYLGALAEPTREALLRLGRQRTFPPDEILIRQGEPGGVIFLLLDGRVNVTACVENGVESLLAIRHPGDILGEMAVLGDSIRTTTVTARIRTIVLVVSGDRFKRFLSTNADAALALTATTTARLKQANTYRADAAGYDVNARLARTLLYQAERFATKSGGLHSVDLRQSELGMLIGAKEGTVQKALKSGALQGVAASRRGKVVIVDVVKLAELADIEPPLRLLDTD